jgi:hypothetical protein
VSAGRFSRASRCDLRGCAAAAQIAVRTALETFKRAGGTTMYQRELIVNASAAASPGPDVEHQFAGFAGCVRDVGP